MPTDDLAQLCANFVGSAAEDTAMYDAVMAGGGAGLWRTDSEYEQVCTPVP